MIKFRLILINYSIFVNNFGMIALLNMKTSLNSSFGEFILWFKSCGNCYMFLINFFKHSISEVFFQSLLKEAFLKPVHGSGFRRFGIATSFALSTATQSYTLPLIVISTLKVLPSGYSMN